jgi:hypothetical protein
MEMREEKNL